MVRVELACFDAVGQAGARPRGGADMRRGSGSAICDCRTPGLPPVGPGWRGGRGGNSFSPACRSEDRAVRVAATASPVVVPCGDARLSTLRRIITRTLPNVKNKMRTTDPWQVRRYRPRHSPGRGRGQASRMRESIFVSRSCFFRGNDEEGCNDGRGQGHRHSPLRHSRESGNPGRQRTGPWAYLEPTSQVLRPHGSRNRDTNMDSRFRGNDGRGDVSASSRWPPWGHRRTPLVIPAKERVKESLAFGMVRDSVGWSLV